MKPKEKEKLAKLNHSFSRGDDYIQGFLLRRNSKFTDKKKHANKVACRKSD